MVDVVDTGGQSTLDTLRNALEAERAKLADDRMKMAEDRLRLADAEVAAAARTAPPKASMWTEWLKPGAILPLSFFAIAAFMTYQHDQAATAKSISDLSGNMATIATRLDHDEQGTAERVKDLVPIIRSSDNALRQNELLNKEQGERIEAIAQSVLQMRQAMDALRDAVQKTHEQLMIDEARREREGRLIMPPRGMHAPTPDDVKAAAEAR